MFLLQMILGKIADDPQSGSCPNVSYADFAGPIANVNPTGSPYAVQQGNHSHSNMSGVNTTMATGSMNGVAAVGNTLANLAAATAALGQTGSNQMFEQIQTTLRNSGFSEQATAEITVAMNTLANYGLLGIGLNGLQALATGSNTSSLSTSNLIGANNTSSLLSTAFSTANSMGYGPVGSNNSAPLSPARATEHRYNMGDTGSFNDYKAMSSGTIGSSMMSSPSSFNGIGGTGSSGAKSPDKETSKIDVEINDNIVGAILGPGGRTLVEIQNYSGANIQISKKGVFAPGTHNRVVSIMGNNIQIQMAQYLMQQKITQEESKRMRQNSLGTSSR